MSKAPNQPANKELTQILQRLIADVDDRMEFAGTMFKTKEQAAEGVSKAIETAAASLLQYMDRVERKARIDETRKYIVYCEQSGNPSDTIKLETLHIVASRRKAELEAPTSEGSNNEL